MLEGEELVYFSVLDILTDVLGDDFDILHGFPCTSSGSFVAFIVELYKVILYREDEIFQCFVLFHLKRSWVLKLKLTK